MAMDLENIMQDTIVIQARAREKQGDRGRSKKWKEILRLPPVAHALSLREEIEHTFEGLIDNQPIGKSLFREFCSTDSALANCHGFLEALDEFVLVAEEKGAVMAKKIYDDFLSPENSERLVVVTVEMVVGLRDKTMLLPVPKDMFKECKLAVREFLSGQPFINYVDSLFYWRYLQWKYLEKAPITKTSFRVYRVLGKGGFGLVHACQSKPTGKMYALKKLEKKRVKKRKGDKLALNEKVILEKVDSRFVVSLAYAYQTKDALCMVLTLMNGGDLRFHIHNIGAPGLDMERTIFYAAEMAAGLSHLHAKRIAYRDMKPDNILLDDLGHVRISDLGLAVSIPEGQSVRGRVGTVGYMAPEVIDNHRYTFAPDWWGLGCIVYEMIHGECPFRKRKERVSREKVEQRVREQELTYADRFTKESKAFCSQLLQKVHSNRLGTSGRGFDDVKSHSFFKSINWNHLEQGILEPPFKPNPRAVYAKDVLDIDAFSSTRGVELEEADESFAANFSTGACSKPWQEEMIETKVFADINKMNPVHLMTLEANTTIPMETNPRGNWLKRLFRFKKQNTAPEPTVSSSSTSTSNTPLLRHNTENTLKLPPTGPKELSNSVPNLHEANGETAAPSSNKVQNCRFSVAVREADAVIQSEDYVEDPSEDTDMHISGSMQSGGGERGRVMDRVDSSSSSASSEKQASASEKQVSASEKQVSASEKQASVQEKQASASEKQASVQEKQVSASEKQASVQEKQVSASEKPASVQEKQVSASEKQAPVQEKQVSASEKPASVQETS